MYDVLEKQKKVVMVQVVYNSKEEKPELAFRELKDLIEADNMVVVGSVLQNRKTPDVRTLIGEGKLEELEMLVEETNADMVIFKNELKGSKIRNLEDYLKVKVMDRTMLILDIFAQRAKSQEGKLQVEVAQLKYSLPRLSSLSGSFGRFGGGVGMRGPGETKLELDRRIIENKILVKRRELEKLEENRSIQGAQRKRSGKLKVSIIGYTNGGKSTLLNCMTKANVLAKDMLFATLDTTTRNLWLGPNMEILLTDTVGFVSELPHDLVEAFKSTLREAMDADLLLQVVDISDNRYREKMEIVADVLYDLGAMGKPMIVCYNKIDKAENIDDIVEDDRHILISAYNNTNIDILKEKIKKILFPNAKNSY